MTMTPKNQPRGFTLVETLIAITILMIAIVGPYYSIQQAIMASYAARDQLIASSLAQEGVEYVYFLRDNNYLSGQGWLTGLDNCRTDSPYNHAYGCTVDPTQNTLATCGAANCATTPLKLSDTGLYTQNGNYPATRFYRSVKVQNLSATQTKVTVIVVWSTEHQNYTVSVEENLYNWL